MRGMLPKDPYNLIITGVGGQGNVLLSRIVGVMLTRKGLEITIGESFGAAQRGGSVMSHLRVSTTGSWSPLIPRGRADAVIALEPAEGLRVLALYGNSGVRTLLNMRPIYPIGVTAGEATYPSLESIGRTAGGLSERCWLLPATEEAQKLGSPILGNIIMLGAFSKISPLPLDREGFEEILREMFPEDKWKVNLQAYSIGENLISARTAGC